MNPGASNVVALKSRDLALEYLQCGNFGRAFSHFLVALQLKPDWKKDLKKEFSHTLCAWGEQLESAQRFKDLFNCYEQAIEIFPENELVLCNLGSHLFSLYAVSAGATDIHACDYSPTMCSIARDVLEANKMADKVTVINKLSNDLSIPHDLPHRKSLVVTETMDAGLLGEHLLQTLLHAWDKLLKPPCPDLLNKLVSGAGILDHGVVVPFGAKLWAVPVQSYKIARQNYILDISKSSWDFSNIWLYSDSSEPYDTENLKGSDKCKFLGDPVELYCYDFNNLKELKGFYSGKFDGKSVSFDYEGKADALAVWFDILLDEDITISSSPFLEDVSCWDQAVFKFQEPKESFLLKVSCSGGKLRFDFCESHFNIVTTNERTRSKYAVSSDVILFINNQLLQKSIIVLPELCDKVLNVLDLSPFPMLGLRFVQQKNSNLYCVLKSEEEVSAVMKFVSDNHLDSSKVKCIMMNELDGMLHDKCYKFDLIFNTLFDTSGEFKEHNVNLIPRLMEQLTPGGVLAPTTITMMCQLADCPWIIGTSKVINEELVQKYNIAPFINVYQVSQLLDVDLMLEECQYLSDSVVCLQVAQEDLASDCCRTKDITVSVVKDGCINALPLWYQYQLSARQEPLSTVERDSNINQVVFVVDPPYTVKSGETVVINVTFLAGIIRLKLSR